MKEIDRFRQWIVEQPLNTQLAFQKLYESQTDKKAIWHRIYPKPFFTWFKAHCKNERPWDVISNV